MKKAGKIITYILIVLILVGAVGIILKLTNGGTTSFKTFYVEVNDNKFFTDVTSFYLKQGETRFETKYVFSSNKPENHKGFTVKVVPNITEETKFEFTVDGQPYSFSGEKDLTEVFDIQTDNTGFTVTNNNLSVKSILQTEYSDHELVLDGNQIDLSKVYFNLVISSYNGESSVTIGLLLNMSLNLDKDGIVF